MILFSSVKGICGNQVPFFSGWRGRLTTLNAIIIIYKEPLQNVI